MIAQVGSISANTDKQVGNIIAEAMKKVGKDGVITIEESKTMETTLDVVEGMQFDRGYLSSYFVTDPARMECVLEEVHILIHEKKISSMQEFLPLLEQDRQNGQATADYRGGHGGRSARDAGCETSCGAHCSALPSRRQALAIAARPCWRILPRSPAAKQSPRSLASSSKT